MQQQIDRLTCAACIATFERRSPLDGVQRSKVEWRK